MDLQLGNRIRDLRKVRGITQEQLADAIGISFQAVSKWETGIALPDITLAPALANYFGITMDTLFDFNLHDLQNKVKVSVTKRTNLERVTPKRAERFLRMGCANIRIMILY